MGNKLKGFFLNKLLNKRRLALRIFRYGAGIVFGFVFFGSAAHAVKLDEAKCMEYYALYISKCESTDKVTVPDEFATCNDAPDDFKSAIAPLVDTFLNKYYNKAPDDPSAQPTDEECKQSHTFLCQYDTGAYDIPYCVDMQKCVTELGTCASLLKMCQGNPGIIKTEDLEGQCKEFLQGGAVKWESFAGTDLCTKATKLEGTVKEKCEAYDAAVYEEKKKQGYIAPPRGYMYEELEESQRLAQKAGMEGLAKSTFNLIGDRNPQQIFGAVIKTLMGILGSIALGMFVYGGFLIMSAAGNAERVGKGTQIVVWSALGVVVIFASYTLVEFVLDII